MGDQCRRLVLLAAALSLLGACGGGQATTEPESPPVETSPPEPEVVSEPPDEVEQTYWQVFWDDIHVMTVYATPGPLRTEEPDNPREIFSGRSAFMSVVSHYYEREREMAALIDRAEDLDDFLRILREEGYEIEELLFEEGY